MKVERLIKFKIEKYKKHKKDFVKKGWYDIAHKWQVAIWTLEGLLDEVKEIEK